MKRELQRILCRTLLAAALLGIMTSVAQAEKVVIKGEVNDAYQVVADGKIYEVAETPKGNEMVENHISETVEIVGTVEEKDDVSIITVHDYKLRTE